MILSAANLRRTTLALTAMTPLLFVEPAIVQAASDSRVTGDGAWAEVLQNRKISHNREMNAHVQRVSERILRAAGQNPDDWEITVIEDESPNAFALPGGKIGVHTGLFKIAETDDELAAVLGHEVAHVTQGHHRQRSNRDALVQLGVGLLGMAFNLDQNAAQLAGNAAMLGLVLPYGRDQESQADEVGLAYMARAGYNPQAAVDLWHKFEDEGGAPPEFLATHPSSGRRAATLAKLVPEYMDTYRAHQNDYGGQNQTRFRDDDSRPNWRLRRD